MPATCFRMYERYAAAHGWKVEVLSSSEGEAGGFKEIIATITGKGVFAKLKFESGVHRVQRVPETEAGGRIHTSAATVAVLPEAEEIDIEVRPEDIRIDTMRSSGAGGQHVNTTDSAVRITHLPTGIVVTSSEKSQHQNRAKAMQVLRSRLYDAERQRADSERSADRKSQVGSGDRSERIRTYNFPQGRVTDHRINLTLYKLDRMMVGEIDEVGRCADGRLSGEPAGATRRAAMSRAGNRPGRRFPRFWPRPAVASPRPASTSRAADARVLVAGLLGLSTTDIVDAGRRDRRRRSRCASDRERHRTPAGA